MKKILLLTITLLCMGQSALNGRTNPNPKKIAAKTKKALAKEKALNKKRQQKNTKKKIKVIKKTPQRKTTSKSTQPKKQLSPEQKKRQQQKRCAEKQLFRHLCAICQTECKKQRISKPVIFEQSRRQNGPTCSYFAAYNGACKIAELTGKAKPAFNLPFWAKAIVARRKRLQQNIKMWGLYGDEIMHLASMLGLKAEDTTFIAPLELASYYELYELQKIQQKLQANKPHLFLCSFMMGTERHAVCTVATKNHYYFLDSNNLPHLFVPMIKALDAKLNATYN